jgi:magnesium-transporting ATPase (P-type)
VRRAANLTLDESQLTGEAEPQDKIAHPGPAGFEAGEKWR